MFVIIIIAETQTFPGTQLTWTAPSSAARAGARRGSGPAARHLTGIPMIQLTKSIYILVSWKYFDESFCQTRDKNQTFTLDDIQFSKNNGSVSHIWKSLKPLISLHLDLAQILDKSQKFIRFKILRIFERYLCKIYRFSWLLPGYVWGIITEGLIMIAIIRHIDHSQSASISDLITVSIQDSRQGWRISSGVGGSRSGSTWSPT